MRARTLPLAFLTLVALAPLAEAQQIAIAEMIFDRLDNDASGDVSLEELRSAKERQFARADSDDDGRVTEAELAAIEERMARFARMGGDALRERALRLDRDGDGALSRDEYTATSPILTLIDADGNGAISRAEFDRARAAFSPQP
jgi:hypothetical protein